MKLKLPIQQEESSEIDITPLIDSIFLLVLFFMLTSTFIEEANVFKVVLPRAEQAHTISREDADFISVTVDGRYQLRDVSGEHTLQDLDELLTRLKERGPEARQRPVVIRCDARCPYSQFVQVKNAVKLAGIETVFEEVEVQP